MEFLPDPKTTEFDKIDNLIVKKQYYLDFIFEQFETGYCELEFLKITELYGEKHNFSLRPYNLF